MTHIACEVVMSSMHPCPGNYGRWQSGVWSCIVPRLPMHQVQELNVGTTLLCIKIVLHLSKVTTYCILRWCKCERQKKKIQFFFLHRFFFSKTAEKNLNFFSPTFFQKQQKKNLIFFSPTFFQKQQKKSIIVFFCRSHLHHRSIRVRLYLTKLGKRVKTSSFPSSC